MRCFSPYPIALLVPVLWIATSTAADPAPKKSADNVKFTVKADKPADGKQVVTIIMQIADGWHIYANPVQNAMFVGAQTTITFTAGGKDVPAKIDYPVGKVENEPPPTGNYNIYDGTVSVKATLDRTGIAAPVEAVVLVVSCTNRICLPSSTVKLKVD